MKHSNIKLQTLQDLNMILLIENNIRGGISSVMGDRYVKSDEEKKILFIDANNLYGYVMCQNLPYDEIKIIENYKLEDILNTSDDSDYGYFIEVDLKYPDEIKEKTRYFPFAPENKFAPQDKFTDYMNSMKGDSYTACKKLIFDWTDKKNYLVFKNYRCMHISQHLIKKKIINLNGCNANKNTRTDSGDGACSQHIVIQLSICSAKRLFMSYI